MYFLLDQHVRQETKTKFAFYLHFRTGKETSFNAGTITLTEVLGGLEFS